MPEDKPKKEDQSRHKELSDKPEKGDRETFSRRPPKDRPVRTQDSGPRKQGGRGEESD